MRALALSLAVLAAPAWAFTIGTLFSNPCHERITTDAFSQSMASWPADQIPGPPRDIERKLAARFVKDFDPEGKIAAEYHYAYMSLIIGVRAPDTEGHSLLDIDNTRLIHAPPLDQYGHALRSAVDDGVEGDAVVATEVRKVIAGFADEARAALAKPRDEQFIDVKFDVEGYGLVTLQLWAPAYLAGRGAHAMQDSFSHSLRNDDFHQVLTFFNYADAIRKTFDETRDGLPHSGTMDSCVERTAPVTTAAASATASYLNGLRDSTAVTQTLDTWLTVKSGCTRENDFCASPWLDFALSDVSEPYLGCSISPLESAAWLLPAWLLFRRRRVR